MKLLQGRSSREPGALTQVFQESYFWAFLMALLSASSGSFCWPVSMQCGKGSLNTCITKFVVSWVIHSQQHDFIQWGNVNLTIIMFILWWFYRSICMLNLFPLTRLYHSRHIWSFHSALLCGSISHFAWFIVLITTIITLRGQGDKGQRTVSMVNLFLYVCLKWAFR